MGKGLPGSGQVWPLYSTYIYLDILTVATKQQTGSSHQGNEDSELADLGHCLEVGGEGDQL